MRSMKLHPQGMIGQQANAKQFLELHSSTHFKTLQRLANDKHHPSEPVDLYLILKRALSQKWQHTTVCQLYQKYATSLWTTLKSKPVTWIRTVVAGCWSSWEHTYSPGHSTPFGIYAMRPHNYRSFPLLGTSPRDVGTNVLSMHYASNTVNGSNRMDFG